MEGTLQDISRNLTKKMSQSSSQTTIFYRDVELSKKVWSIKDSGGFPAPKGRDGIRAMPFWSSKSRAESIIKNVAAYEGFEPIELNIKEFYELLLELRNDNQLVGINWSGKMATGYDLKPEIVIKWIDNFNPPQKTIWKKLFNG